MATLSRRESQALEEELGIHSENREAWSQLQIALPVTSNRFDFPCALNPNSDVHMTQVSEVATQTLRSLPGHLYSCSPQWVCLYSLS